MPLKHSAISARRRKISIPFGEDGDLSVTYNPAKVTPNFRQQLLDDAEETPGLGEARIVAAVVTDWDYEDDKGKPFPLALESLREVPNLVLNRIVEEVFKDLRPPPPPSENSGSFS
jgi:hypothetical protein